MFEGFPASQPVLRAPSSVRSTRWYGWPQKGAFALLLGFFLLLAGFGGRWTPAGSLLSVPIANALALNLSCTPITTPTTQSTCTATGGLPGGFLSAAVSGPVTPNGPVTVTNPNCSSSCNGSFTETPTGPGAVMVNSSKPVAVDVL